MKCGVASEVKTRTQNGFNIFHRLCVERIKPLDALGKEIRNIELARLAGRTGNNKITK